MGIESLLLSALTVCESVGTKTEKNSNTLRYVIESEPQNINSLFRAYVDFRAVVGERVFQYLSLEKNLRIAISSMNTTQKLWVTSYLPEGFSMAKSHVEKANRRKNLTSVKLVGKAPSGSHSSAKMSDPWDVLPSSDSNELDSVSNILSLFENQAINGKGGLECNPIMMLNAMVGKYKRIESHRKILIYLLSCQKQVFDVCVLPFPLASLNALCQTVKLIVRKCLFSSNGKVDIQSSDDAHDMELESGISVHVTESNTPVVRCASASIARILDLILRELENDSAINKIEIRNQYQDRVMLLEAVLQEGKDAATFAVEYLLSKQCDVLVEVCYILCPCFTKAVLLKHQNSNKGSIEKIWERWIQEDRLKKPQQAFLRSAWKLHPMNEPILGCLKNLSSGHEQRRQDSICILRIVAMRHPTILLQYRKVIGMIFQGSDSNVEGNVLGNTNISSLFGEPTIMLGVITVLDSMNPFMLESNMLREILVMLLRIIDMHRGRFRKQLYKFRPVTQQSVDLLLSWINYKPTKIRNIIEEYSWPQSLLEANEGKKQDDDASFEKASVPNTRPIAVEVLSSKSYSDFPLVRQLAQLLLSERNSLDKDMLSSMEKIRLSKLMKNEENISETLSWILELSSRWPGIIDLVFDELIAIVKVASESNSEAPAGSQALALKSLELLLIHGYVCSDENQIKCTFEAFLQFLTSSKVEAESKVVALKVSNRFVNLALTVKEFQSLLRICFGLSSSLGSGAEYELLTNSVRSGFENL